MAKKNIKEEMERMRRQAQLDSPKFDVAKHVTSTSPGDADAAPLPVDARPPIDYEEIMRDSMMTSEKRVRQMAMVMMGNTVLLEEEWIKEKLEIDVDRLGRATKAIVTFGDKINDVLANIDAYPEDDRWYKILMGMQEKQNSNVNHRDKLLQQMQQEYGELVERYQQMYPEKFTRDDERDEMNIVDPAAMNELLARIKKQEKAEQEERMAHERKQREDAMAREMAAKMSALQDDDGPPEEEEREDQASENGD